MGEPPRAEPSEPFEPSEPSERDALRALEERLDRATAAAERLIAEAAGGGVPPGGWQRPRDDDGTDPFRGWLGREDAELLVALVARVRDRVPAELQARLAAAVHELLLALRALIDWCLERAERRRVPPAEVQDIPIL